MIYQTPAQMGLWLRLIHAARTNDQLLATTLEELMQGGADLGLKPDGGLQFGSGTMPEATYRQKTGEVLYPRRVKLANLGRQIHATPHPWLPAFQAAYTDLNGRCQRGQAMLVEQAKRGDTKQWADTMTNLATRHLQAYSIASVLALSYVRYGDSCSTHCGGFQDCWKALTDVGRPYDRQAGVSWPVQTPDGWLWVIDVPGTAPQEVDLGGKVGKKMPLPDEPVVLDYELSGMMAPLELQQREAS